MRQPAMSTTTWVPTFMRGTLPASAPKTSETRHDLEVRQSIQSCVRKPACVRPCTNSVSGISVVRGAGALCVRFGVLWTRTRSIEIAHRGIGKSQNEPKTHTHFHHRETKDHTYDIRHILAHIRYVGSGALRTVTTAHPTARTVRVPLTQPPSGAELTISFDLLCMVSIGVGATRANRATTVKSTDASRRTSPSDARLDALSVTSKISAIDTSSSCSSSRVARDIAASSRTRACPADGDSHRRSTLS